jgi:hypothetical protein
LIYADDATVGAAENAEGGLTKTDEKKSLLASIARGEAANVKANATTDLLQGGKKKHPKKKKKKHYKKKKHSSSSSSSSESSHSSNSSKSSEESKPKYKKRYHKKKITTKRPYPMNYEYNNNNGYANTHAGNYDNAY